jgi:hypothetical protein
MTVVRGETIGAIGRRVDYLSGNGMTEDPG